MADVQREERRALPEPSGRALKVKEHLGPLWDGEEVVQEEKKSQVKEKCAHPFLLCTSMITLLVITLLDFRPEIVNSDATRG